MRIAQTVYVGLFFVIGLVLIYLVYVVIGDNRLRAEEGLRLVARFDDLQTLAPGDDVRMAGVRIGTVEDTRLSEGQGIATLLISTDISVPRDSVAAIAVASLLGQNYVAVNYGAAEGYLLDGDAIRTRPSVDFNTILTEVQQLGERFSGAVGSFENISGEDISQFFRNINALVSDNRERINTIMANMETVSGQLTGTEGTLGKLINDPAAYDELQATFETFHLVGEETRALVAQVQSAFDRMDAGEGTLGRLLAEDSLARDLEATAANLRAFSDTLRGGEGTLGKLISDDELYQEIRNLVTRADQALDAVSDSGPITAVGAASGALF